MVNEPELGNDVERNHVADQLVRILAELGGRAGAGELRRGRHVSCRTSRVVMAMATTPSDKASTRSTPGRSSRGPVQAASVDISAHGLRVIKVHDLRHTTATLLQRRGVASDATFRAWREDVAARDAGPAGAGRRSRRQSEPAGQDGRDRTALRQMPGCCIHSGCIRVQHDAARATKKRSDEGRCHYRPVVTLTHSAWFVIRSLPVRTWAYLAAMLSSSLAIHDWP